MNRGYFSSLFQIADKDNKGILIGKEAAEFLKKSGLPKESLKIIWIISAQTDHQHLERDEFYLALRLVALAQNNMEYTEESIRINHPIPPLPKFDLKNNTTSAVFNKSVENNSLKVGMSVSQSANTFSPNFVSNISISEFDPFIMNEADTQKYTALFNKNKDMDNKMSINKAYQMWTTGGVSIDTIKKIFVIVPIADKTCLNYNEFRVIFHLIYKSLQYDIPTVLPGSLKKVLFPENQAIDGVAKIIPQSSKDINFGEKLGIDLNLGKSKEKKENTVSSLDVNNNANVNSKYLNINNSNNNNDIQKTLNHNTNVPQVNTNKSVDMESLLMNEFNLKNNPQVNTINTITSPLYPQHISNLTQQMSNNIKTINNLSNNITDKFNNVYADKVNENKFLEQTLDEEIGLLNHLREQVENIYISINQINLKNSTLINQISDVKRQIEVEKESLSRGISELNQRTNELISNQGNIDK